MSSFSKRLAQMPPDQRRSTLQDLPTHLAKALQAEKLHHLLTNFHFMEAKVFALGVQPLIEDYDLVLNPDLLTSQEGVKLNVDNLKLIQGALRLSAHILAQDKTQLAGQLLGRLLSFEAQEIQVMLKQAQQWKALPWLRPLSPNLIPPSNSLQRTLEGHTDWVSAVAVAAGGQWAVSASYDHTLKVWDLNTGRELRTLTGHTEWVWAVAITADEKLAVSASDDCTLKVWDLTNGQKLRTLVGHLNWVNAVTVTADGEWAVSVSDDCTLRVWNLDSGLTLLPLLLSHTNWVYGVAVTADKRWAISASADYTLKVLDFWNRTEVHTLKGHSEAVMVVAVTVDDKQVISASADHTLKVWDLASGQERQTLAGHNDSVLAVAVTADGKRAISVSRDRTLKVWDLTSKHIVSSFKGDNIFTACAVAADGVTIVAGDSLGCLHFLRLEGV